MKESAVVMVSVPTPTLIVAAVRSERYLGAAIAECTSFVAARHQLIHRQGLRAEIPSPGRGLLWLVIRCVGELIVAAAVAVPDIDEINRQPVALRDGELLRQPLREGEIVLDIGAGVRVAGTGCRDGKRLVLLLGEVDPATAAAIERPFRRGRMGQ
jgi:hypothetical protein